MPPTKREVDVYMAKHPKTAPQFTMDLLKSAAVQSERLTGQPEWDAYLQRLQPLLDEAKAAAAGWLERLGGALKDEDVRIAQFNYHACRARVATLEEVMALPHTIIEAHRSAGIPPT